MNSLTLFLLYFAINSVASFSPEDKTRLLRDTLTRYFAPRTCHVLGINIQSPELSEFLNEFAASIILMEGDLRMNSEVMASLNKFSSCKIFLTEDWDMLLEMDRFGSIYSILPDAMFYISMDEKDGLHDLPEIQTQSLIALQRTRNDGAHIYLTCKYYKYNGRATLVNTWKPDRGFLFKGRMGFQDCKNSIQGQEVRIMYVLYTPVFIMKNGKLDGVEKLWMDHLIQATKIKATFTRIKTWGTWFEKTNTTVGMVDEIQKGNVDLGVSTPGISYQRYQIVRFTDHVNSGVINYFCRKPVLIPSYLNIIKPFTPFVWGCIMASTVVLSILMMIDYHLLKRLNKDSVRKEVPGLNFFIIPVSYLLEQGNLNWYKSWSSGRILEILWDTIRTILILAYCCNLRAFLIAKEYTKPVDSAYDFVEQKRDLYLYANSMTSTVLLNSPLSIDKRVVEEGFNGEFLYYDSKGLIPMEHHRLFVEKGACMMNLEQAVKTLAMDLVKEFGHFPYHIARDPVGRFYAGFMMPKWKFPWKEEISRLSNQMRDMHIYRILLKRFMSEAVFEQREPIIIDALALEHFVTVFFLLFIGIAFSGLAFIYEVYKFRISKWLKPRKNMEIPTFPPREESPKDTKITK